MGKPAGIQIKRWFGMLVGLLLVVDLAALGGSFVISQSIRRVVAQAEPLASATAAIRAETLGAQRDLFRYLAEFVDDTTPALQHLDNVGPHVQVARAGVGTGLLANDLDEIEKSVERYRKVLELMPRTVEGSRDWSRLQEYSSTAIELGNAVEEISTRLAQAAQEEIRVRSRNANRAAAAAMWTSVGVFALSIFAILALRHWWKQFQELLLGM